MNARKAIDRMSRFPDVLRAMLSGISADDARWKPDDAHWSILEIVRHLADEEREDFRARLRSTLEDPKRAWPPIDPEGWAKQRDYNGGELRDALHDLINERAASLRWLETLAGDDWSASHDHPKLGRLSAGDLLAAWAAHDLLHVRQIAKRLFQLNLRDSKPYSPRYSGDLGT